MPHYQGIKMLAFSDTSLDLPVQCFLIKGKFHNFNTLEYKICFPIIYMHMPAIHSKQTCDPLFDPAHNDKGHKR